MVLDENKTTKDAADTIKGRADPLALNVQQLVQVTHEAPGYP